MLKGEYEGMGGRREELGWLVGVKDKKMMIFPHIELRPNFKLIRIG